MDANETIESLVGCLYNLCKEAVEYTGYDMGSGKPNIEYRNYLIDNPLQFNSGGILGGGIGVFGGLGEFNMDNINSNDFDAYNSGGYNIMNGVKYRMKVLTNLSNAMPIDFKTRVINLARQIGVPPILFMFIGLSEGGFKDAKSNSLGYGGYFGQPSSQGIGYGAPLEVQAKAIIPNAFKRILNQGADKLSAIGLTYVSHQLPVIGQNIWKDTNGHPWRSNASEMAQLLNAVYNKHMKTPMSSTRLAEAMMCNLYAQYAISYISSAPELQQYL